MEASLLSFPFAYVGTFLRTLSLKGGAYNGLAWFLFLAVDLIPCGIYGWLKLKGKAVKLDLWLIGLSGYLFYALYYMVNPYAFSQLLPEMTGLVLNVGFYAFLFSYLVLRMLGWIRSGEKEALLKGLGMMLVILAVCYGIELVASLIRLPEALKSLRAGNTSLQSGLSGLAQFVGDSNLLEMTGNSGMDAASLSFSCGILVLQSVVMMVPVVCGLVISILGARLVGMVRTDLYSQEAIEGCKKLGLLCTRSLGLIILTQLGLNGIQIIFHSYILNLSISANLPVASVFYTLIVLLITTYMKENQALKEENDSFI